MNYESKPDNISLNPIEMKTNFHLILLAVFFFTSCQPKPTAVPIDAVAAKMS
jgi:hypothetical protein